MKIAIMQPYLFPYIGYFQLINAVDKFIIYDDVNFINKGWINRNKILINNKPNLFTIPLRKSSQNKLINDIEMSFDSGLKNKFLNTIEHSYKKAPYFKKVYELISGIILYKENNISKFILNSLFEIKNFLGIRTDFIESSSIYNNSELRQQERIIDICKIEKATHYVNLMGGMEYYARKEFTDQGIKINFIRSKEIKYSQFNDNFINSLSIIDILMFNSKDKIAKYLNAYDLV